MQDNNTTNNNNNNNNGWEISWLDKPKKHNYKDARNYLRLVYTDRTTNKLIDKLEDADVEGFIARDLARAAKMYHIIGDIRPAVERISTYIQEGKPIAPVLLVRQPNNGKLVIADGYHRIAAIFLLDPYSTICAKIV